MDELKDKYEDLNNLFENLEIAENETTDKIFKEQILGLMREVQIEIEQLEPKISKQEQEENKELLREYNEGRL